MPCCLSSTPAYDYSKILNGHQKNALALCDFVVAFHANSWSNELKTKRLV